MASISFSGNTLTSPIWAADDLGPPNLVPGGAKINATDFTADPQGRKHIPAGTLLGRTFAERTAGTGFGPANAASDEEIYLTAFDVTDAVINNDVELYRHGGLVKENFLPNWLTLAAGTQAKIRELYECVTGVA